MSVPLKYVRYQGPVLRGMGEAAFAAFKQRAGWATPGEVIVPGPVHTVTVPPRAPELIGAYARHVGGDPSAYRKIVPAHLFPQWTFPLTGKLVDGLKYPMLAAMNGGCKLTIDQPLPAGEPLQVSGQLVSIDDNGSRAILDQKMITGTRSAPDAITAHLYVFIPLNPKDKKTGENGNGAAKGKPKDKARVPVDARELAYWKLSAEAGLDFAKLTGDFNPVHWVPAWAHAFGFKSTILHGFGTMARAFEGLVRTKFAGDVNAIREFDVRFTRPLVLPARVGLYIDGERIWVGDAPGGPAYLEGSFKTRERSYD
ncbi:MAG TPA: MaoC/PaaZ C-terminal domain-containing protein [Polyangia bacterium]|jgi:acyl dehydratase|nr:MaoC/PaaZ C-terminal domain-containing protein [Polyangia bacterium]